MKTASRIIKALKPWSTVDSGSGKRVDTLAAHCRRFGFAVLFSIVPAATLTAQTTIEVSDSAAIHFPLSRWKLNPTLDNNEAHLDSLSAFISRYDNPDSAFTLSSVKVVGGASPEGSISINERLSRKRAESIFDYFSKRNEIPDSVTSFEFIGRDWRGLRQLVIEDTHVPFRSDVLELLDDITAKTPIDATTSDKGLASLRKMHGGSPYRYLFTNLFPQLRASRLYVKYTGQRRAEEPADTVTIIPEPVDTVVEIVEEEIPVPMELGTVKECKPFYMDLRSNLVFDALAIPSIGAEFYIGKNWSVGGNVMYGWWDKDSRHRYWRAYGGDINVRRWFGKRAEDKPLTGHHVGLYAGVVTYDFEFGGKGYMGGLPHRSLWSRCNYYGGIEYGYSLPVSRRLNFDFTIGVGYFGGEYIKYVPKDNRYIWQEKRNLKWFGPTKLEISLVWLIGCDNYNRSKEGGRK